MLPIFKFKIKKKTNFIYINIIQFNAQEEVLSYEYHIFTWYVVLNFTANGIVWKDCQTKIQIEDSLNLSLKWHSK